MASKKLTQSPAWEKPQDVMKRHLLKRKSSKYLVSENSRSLETVKEFLKDNTNLSNTKNNQPNIEISNALKNITNSPAKSQKRSHLDFKDSLKLTDVENSKKFKSNESFNDSENNIDWDDTTARSSFECSFIRKNSNNILSNGNAFFEEKLSQSINDLYPIDFSQFSSLCSSTPKIESTKNLKKNGFGIPLDLRIGTKARIVLKVPYLWMDSCLSIGSYPVKISSEEITTAMRLSMNGYAENKIIDGFLHKTPLALLQSSAMYYQSNNSTTKIVWPRLDGTIQSKKVLKNTNENNEWTESLNHLYSTWFDNQRQLFYVCAYSFTALFIRSLCQSQDLIKAEDFLLQKNTISPLSSSSSLPLNPENSAIDSCFLKNEKDNYNGKYKVVITPTTSGLRDLLKKEGIFFSLPLRGNDNFLNIGEEDCEKDFNMVSNGQKSNDEVEPLDNDEWLKEIGISPKNTFKFRKTVSSVDFSKENLDTEYNNTIKNATQDTNLNNCEYTDFWSLDFKKKSLKNKGSNATTDEARRSTIVITQTNSIEIFYKLLREQKIGLTKNGIYANLPPTLLAPTPFFNSLPKKLKLFSQITRKNGELNYILELCDGPILPTTTKLLVEFLSLMNSTKKKGKSLIKSDPKTNSGLIQILGRIPYSGLNEAVDSQLATNIDEFEINFLSGTFSW